MKIGIKKIWWSIPMLLVLAAIVYYGYLQQNNTSANILSFRIGNADVEQTISAWYDDEGTYYVFLPSYADIRAVTAIVSPSCKVEVDDIALTSKTDLSTFTMGEPYDIRITQGQESVEEQICFLQSANVATMYIDTQSGSMKQIHEDKDHKESVRVAVFDESGIESYVGHDDKLKGRGQATWMTKEKKSYLLTLEYAHKMLEMDAAKKWVLLSNSYDVTNLRNKAVYDLAGETGLKWTPKCRYIDLYLNGSYAGLYLLTEKVEINEQRLNLKSNEETEYISFLCKNELTERWDSLRNPFLTDYGRAVEIVSPNLLTESQKEQITHDVQLMENVILFGDTRDLTRYIDLDSWARKYLIDEIFANIDADLASSYFYCDYSDGKPVFYAGPIWDYDMSFGALWPRNNNPRAFYANAEFESSDWATPYYYCLYQKDDFYKRMVEIYKDELLPLVMALKSYEIEQQAAFIAHAAKMNQIRWFGSEDDISGSQMIDFLSERVAFLNEVWLDGMQYFAVQIEPYVGGAYMSYAVKAGEKLPALPDAVEDNLVEPVWRDRDTGEVFDFNQPITKDTTLLLKNRDIIASEEETNTHPEVTTTSSLIDFISLCKAMPFHLAAVGLLSIILLALIWVDCKRNRVKR